MIGSTKRRSWRRTIATVAGTALVATGLGMGAAPAHAADSVIIGNLTDTQGNPAEGIVEVYAQQADSSFAQVGTEFASGGHFESSYPDGVYKFSYSTYDSSYTEYYRDKADLATADPVTVGGGFTTLQAWTVERPLVIGNVNDAAGRPLQGSYVAAYDAASGSQVWSDYTDEKGAFYLPVGTAPVKILAEAPFNTRLQDEWYNDKMSFATADAVTGSPTGTYLAMGLTGGGSVTGQVVSDAGVPLEHVQVSTGSGSDLTDKFGVYLVEGLAAGSYTLRFSDPLNEYAGEYYNNVTDVAAATPVTVGKDQAVSGINANLTPLPAPTPSTVEVTGVVKDDAGAPVVGAFVTAYTTPNGPAKEESVEFTRANRAGVYVFDELDQVAGENQFKVFAGSDGVGDDNGFDLFSSWYGGRTSYDRAATVTITPGAPVGGVDVTLMRAGGVEGSVTGVSGMPLEGSVLFLSEDGEYTNGTGTEVDNTFELRSLYPGTYKVQFSDSSGNHVPEWWKNSTFAKATEITVKPGQMTGGLDAVLGAALVATERPEAKGYPWVGKSISVDKGEWNYVTGTRFSYEWLIGSTVVGTGSSYTPSKSQIGDKLTVRVLAENGRLVGSATSAKTTKIGYKPKVKIKLAGGKAAIKVKAKPVKAKKIKGKVVVKEIVKVKNDGSIKYKKIGKTKIAKGKGTVSLAKLKKGKHKLVFFFKGKGKVGSTEVKKKVKIKR